MPDERGEGNIYSEGAGGEDRFRSDGIRSVLGKDEEGFGELLGKATKAPSFMDAIIDLWGKIDGLSLTGERRPSINLKDLPPRLLKSEYAFWAALKPEDLPGEVAEDAAEVRASILQAITNAAQERGIFSMVVLGVDWDARTAGETSEFKDTDVIAENREVGEFFGATIRELAAETPPSRERLLQIDAECRALQDRHNLRKTYKQEDVDSYSKTDLALLRLEEHIARELPRATESGQERRDLHPVDWQAERNRVLERTRQLQQRAQQQLEETRRQGKRDETYRPPPRDAQEIAISLLKAGHDPETVPEIASAIAQGPRASADALSRVAREFPDLGKELPRRSDEVDYDKMKKKLLANDDWTEFNWSQADKEKIIPALNLSSRDDAINIMAAMLLHGQSSKDVIKVMGQEGRGFDLGGYMDNLSINVNDDEAFKILIPSEQKRRNFLSYQYYQNDPSCIEDLAWQAEFSEPNLFGKNGPYPVLSKTVYFDNETNRFALRERVDIANMIEWLRYTEIRLHANHTQRPEMDFAQEGGLVKSLKTFNFYEILTLQNRIGTSKYGGNYTRFIWEIEIETVRAGLPRMRSLLGWHMKGDADEMVKMRKQQNFENNFTRPFYAQSMATWHLKTSERYDIDTKALPDGKVGAVSNTILMAYDKLLNLPELARTLDLGTPGQEPTAQDIGKLFNLKNLEESRKSLAGDAGLEGEKYLRLTPDNTINGIRLGDIFDFSTGLPKLDTKLEQLRFLKFINFYRANADDHGARVIRGVIGTHAAKLHGLVTTVNGVDVPYNKTLAELEAFWYSNTLGISVRNAVFDERHQWESQLTGMHRWGQAGGRPDEGVKRKGVVGKYGNYWTIKTFKRPFVEPMYAYRTTASTGSKTVHQVFDEAQKLRLKIDREIAAKADAYMKTTAADARVEKKMKAIGDAQEKRIRNHEMKITDAKDLYETAWNEVRVEAWDLLLKQNEQGLRAYKEKAEELIFPDDAERRYQTDHYDRLYSLDKKIRLEGLKLDKYIKTVPLVGATFDADEFHRDMGQLITDFRYAFKEYGSEINFGEMVWDWDPVLEKSVKMRRGDSMFGKEVWDDPRFKDKHGNTNWDFVNTPEGRDILLRRLVGCYLIGQVLQHREIKRWSTDGRYSFSMTEDILDAIRKIPGVVELGENMRDVNVSEYFFEGMMGWIRKKSGTGRYGMYTREGISTYFLGTPGQKDGFMLGLGNSLGDLVKESFAPFS